MTPPCPCSPSPLPDGQTRTLAQVRRMGANAQMVDPANPAERNNLPIASAASNYIDPFLHFDVLAYLRNSVFVTVVATLLTLLTNSTAAFALSKSRFRGRDAVMLAIVSVVWDWNDVLGPLMVLSRRECYTRQIGLNTCAGELNVEWHHILSMSVVTMIPVVLVFILLRRVVATGIARAGVT